MKTKIYSLLIFSLFVFAIKSQAQCSVTMNSLTTVGLTATGTSTGTGATAPTYVWLWGDSQNSATQNASHTYASAGTYTVCVVYADASNFSCADSTCRIIVVSATSGIPTSTRPQMEITAMPNPFSTSTSIQVTLTEQEQVNMTVYDITGQQVATIYDGMMQTGQHIIIWKPDGMADGIYFLEIKAGDISEARKIIFDSQGN